MVQSWLKIFCVEKKFYKPIITFFMKKPSHLMIRTFKHFNEMHMCVQFQINVIQKDLATDCYNKI